MQLQGIAKGVQIQGVGHVAWSFVDTTGMLTNLETPSLVRTRSESKTAEH
jgi:hypothetical protein